MVGTRSVSARAVGAAGLGGPGGGGQQGLALRGTSRHQSLGKTVHLLICTHFQSPPGGRFSWATCYLLMHIGKVQHQQNHGKGCSASCSTYETQEGAPQKLGNEPMARVCRRQLTVSTQDSSQWGDCGYRILTSSSPLKMWNKPGNWQLQ